MNLRKRKENLKVYYQILNKVRENGCKHVTEYIERYGKQKLLELKRKIK